MKLFLFTALFMTVSPHSVFGAKTPLSPEAEIAYIARHLKPIPDEEWNTVAGPRSQEKYVVVKGDTLYDISKHLFGDVKYWPKIWSLNNDDITNPHKIYPGEQLAFLAGSGSSLPSLSVWGSESATDVSLNPLLRSQDWKNLPKQPWEVYNFSLPPDVDPLGFEKNMKINIRRATGFEAFAVPASEKLNFLGEIFGSRTEGNYLTINDTVYIEADDKLQIGETYAITSEPELLKSRKSDRVGYSYLILGKIKILGFRDNLYIGRVITTKDYAARGTSIIPLPPRVPNLTPIPGPTPLLGTLLIDHRFSTFTTAQHKEVFIDRGIADGVRPGMIFRAYQHYDPSNDKKVSSANFIIDADIMVTQVSPNFCTGLVIRTISPIMENAPVILLTDISDVLKNQGFTEKAPDRENPNDLDKFDADENLGKDERRELKQLEQWKDPTPKAPETPPLVPVEPVPPPTSSPDAVAPPAPAAPPIEIVPEPVTPITAPPVTPEAAPSGATVDPNNEIQFTPPPPPPPAAAPPTVETAPTLPSATSAPAAPVEAPLVVPNEPLPPPPPDTPTQ